MKKKILTAVCIGAVVALVVASKLLTNYVFDAFVLVLMGVLTYECSSLFKKSKRENFALANVVYALCSFTVVLLCVLFGLKLYLTFICLIGSAFVYYLFVYVVLILCRETPRIKKLAKNGNMSIDKFVFRSVVNSFVVALYVCVLPSLFILLNHVADIEEFGTKTNNAFSLYLIIITLLIPIATDTFAMFGGMLFKGPKLLPEISPKKTISGAIIGTCFSMIVVTGAYLVGKQITGIAQVLTDYNLNILNFLLLGMVGAVVSQVGDFFESYLKRKANVKDVSNILPGHGGFMDRLDSHIFCAPFVLLFFIIVALV